MAAKKGGAGIKTGCNGCFTDHKGPPGVVLHLVIFFFSMRIQGELNMKVDLRFERQQPAQVGAATMAGWAAFIHCVACGAFFHKGVQRG